MNHILTLFKSLPTQSNPFTISTCESPLMRDILTTASSTVALRTPSAVSVELTSSPTVRNTSVSQTALVLSNDLACSRSRTKAHCAQLTTDITAADLSAATGQCGAFC